jgi:tetratricopeptide (TPR) repeat protein
VRLILFLSVPARCVIAQEGEDAWRNLLTQGQHAASAMRPVEAEQAFVKALHEAERFGPEDWRVGVTLQSLGETYRTEKKSSDAVSALQRALILVDKTNGEDSAEAAAVRYDLGGALLDSGHAAEAVVHARRALVTYQSRFGGRSQQAAGAFCLVGDSLRSLRNFIDAEEALHRCADIREQTGGIDSIELADALYSLALAYAGEKKYRDADLRFGMAEKIREHKLGITSPLLAQTFEDHAALLKTLGREKDAAQLLKFAQAIRRTGKEKP